MSETEYYTQMCVRFGWTEEEQRVRRNKAAVMQEKLLFSIVRRSIETVQRDTAGMPKREPDAVSAGTSSIASNGLFPHGHGRMQA